MITLGHNSRKKYLDLSGKVPHNGKKKRKKDKKQPLVEFFGVQNQQKMIIHNVGSLLIKQEARSGPDIQMYLSLFFKIIFVLFSITI